MFLLRKGKIFNQKTENVQIEGRKIFQLENGEILQLEKRIKNPIGKSKHISRKIEEQKKNSKNQKLEVKTFQRF